MTYQPKRLLLQWHITERCNLRCEHCYQDSFKGDELSHVELLSVLEQFTDLLTFWRDQSSLSTPGHITITGGEPFVRSDFLDLLEVFAAQKDIYSFAILTNGSLIDRKRAEYLRALDPAFVQVSIEGTEQTHDSIRGEGNYQLTVEAIRNLVQAKLPTLISFTAHRQNYREFPAVVRLARKMDVTRVWSDRMIPLGSGLNRELLNPEETREFFKLMRRSKLTTDLMRMIRLSHTELSMRRALQHLIVGGAPYHCTAGDGLITVQPNGDLLPCRRMPVTVGNLMQTSLSKLYDESALFVALRDQNRISNGCETCAAKRSCRGGLKCLSYATAGDPFQADPGCWRASDRLIARSLE